MKCDCCHCWNQRRSDEQVYLDKLLSLFVECPKCNGEGIVVGVEKGSMVNFMVNKECSFCYGRGFIVTGNGEQIIDFISMLDPSFNPGKYERVFWECR